LELPSHVKFTWLLQIRLSETRYAPLLSHGQRRSEWESNCTGTPYLLGVINLKSTFIKQVRIFADFEKLDRTITKSQHWLFLPTDGTLDIQSWQNVVYPFSVSSDRLRLITQEMVEIFRENLRKTALGAMLYLSLYSHVHCTDLSVRPTYVTHIPDGKEKGEFFALSVTVENGM
jgi:hypothetical protein